MSASQRRSCFYTHSYTLTGYLKNNIKMGRGEGVGRVKDQNVRPTNLTHRDTLTGFWQIVLKGANGRENELCYNSKV